MLEGIAVGSELLVKYNSDDLFLHFKDFIHMAFIYWLWWAPVMSMKTTFMRWSINTDACGVPR